MNKILALDLGDQWTGIALSDISRMFAKPFHTAPTASLDAVLTDIFNKEPIDIIVVGYPKTMRGTESDQTRKVLAAKKNLEEKFSHYTWVLWDERLSSKRAQSTAPAKSKQEKLKSHAIAAAFILDSYLTFLSNQAKD